MSSHRLERVEKQVHQIIANFLLTGLKDQPPGLLSVTRVEVSKDLRHASVYISQMAFNDEETGTCQEFLDEHRSEIQRHLGRELKTKFVPKLRLIDHQGLKHMAHIDEVLHKLK